MSTARTPAMFKLRTSLSCGHPLFADLRHVATSGEPACTAPCPIALGLIRHVAHHPLSRFIYLGRNLLLRGCVRRPSLPLGSISAHGARRCHLTVSPDLHATRPLPASPHYLTPRQIEIAGLRPPSIFGYVAASPPLTCPSIPPRNGHGTHHDMCHFSAIPHYLSQGHLHLAGIPPPSISTTWCDPVSFRKIISYRQILPLTSHISDRPEIGPTTRPLPS